MENKTIARKFRLLAQLMELHGENPFKIRATANASFKLDKLPFNIVETSENVLSNEQGIGKSIASKVWELIQHGCIKELEDLLAKTPAGLLEMLSIKGLGPKKILIIWKTLSIETVGELYYACNENRLVEAKGFGLKTQEEIKKAIEFTMANEGFFLYASVEKVAIAIFQEMRDRLPLSYQLEFTGDFRRKMEVLHSIDFLTSAPLDIVLSAVQAISSLIKFDTINQEVQAVHESGLALRFTSCSVNDFAKQWLLSTGNEQHIVWLTDQCGGSIPVAASEKAIYQSAQFNFIEPELREGLYEMQWATRHTLPKLIEYQDLKGSLHNHSTYSDGVHSLEEMARYCKDTLQLQYLGICDHSQSAVYAKGLSEQSVLQQWAEIEELNKKLAPFKIFKGIESDILSDGSLDYPDTVLKGFDFVVASIHSNLKMDEEKATKRLIKAIENPYTTILGHPTGRLLLSRKGYPIDFKKVIDACAANQVVIEINANPLRLDLDWRWHQYAVQKGVTLSINPDAHRVDGFLDMRYGTQIARKGGVMASQCLNCLDGEQLMHYFAKRKEGNCRRQHEYL